jgi:hypothetical protein
MTRSQRILELLELNPQGMSCQSLTHSIANAEGLTDSDNRKMYLSGSVSSKLLALIKKGVIKKSETVTGPQGGAIYKIVDNESK